MTSYAYARRVHWSECDPAGIIFFPNYAVWAVDGFNEMLHAAGYVPNRQLPAGGSEGIPCVEFRMQFFHPPQLNSVVSHEISAIEIKTTSFTLCHRFSLERILCAEILDTRVWSIHKGGRLQKHPIPPEVLTLLEGRRTVG